MLRNVRQEARELCDEMVSFMFGEDVNNRDFWFKSPMIDRSVGGFSFKTSINNVIKFKVGQKIQFKFKTMGSYASAVIVNVNQLSDGRSLKISVKNL